MECLGFETGDPQGAFVLAHELSEATHRPMLHEAGLHFHKGQAQACMQQSACNSQRHCSASCSKGQTGCCDAASDAEALAKALVASEFALDAVLVDRDHCLLSLKGACSELAACAEHMALIRHQQRAQKQSENDQQMALMESVARLESCVAELESKHAEQSQEQAFLFESKISGMENLSEQQTGSSELKSRDCEACQSAASETALLEELRLELTEKNQIILCQHDQELSLQNSSKKNRGTLSYLEEKLEERTVQLRKSHADNKRQSCLEARLNSAVAMSDELRDELSKREQQVDADRAEKREFRQSIVWLKSNIFNLESNLEDSSLRLRFSEVESSEESSLAARFHAASQEIDALQAELAQQDIEVNSHLQEKQVLMNSIEWLESSIGELESSLMDKAEAESHHHNQRYEYEYLMAAAATEVENIRVELAESCLKANSESDENQLLYDTVESLNSKITELEAIAEEQARKLIVRQSKQDLEEHNTSCSEVVELRMELAGAWADNKRMASDLVTLLRAKEEGVDSRMAEASRDACPDRQLHSPAAGTSGAPANATAEAQPTTVDVDALQARIAQLEIGVDAGQEALAVAAARNHALTVEMSEYKNELKAHKRAAEAEKKKLQNRLADAWTENEQQAGQFIASLHEVQAQLFNVQVPSTTGSAARSTQSRLSTSHGSISTIDEWSSQYDIKVPAEPVPAQNPQGCVPSNPTGNSKNWWQSPRDYL